MAQSACPPTSRNSSRNSAGGRCQRSECGRRRECWWQFWRWRRSQAGRRIARRRYSPPPGRPVPGRSDGCSRSCRRRRPTDNNASISASSAMVKADGNILAAAAPADHCGQCGAGMSIAMPGNRSPTVPTGRCNTATATDCDHQCDQKARPAAAAARRNSTMKASVAAPTASGRPAQREPNERAINHPLADKGRRQRARVQPKEITDLAGSDDHRYAGGKTGDHRHRYESDQLAYARHSRQRSA